MSRRKFIELLNLYLDGEIDPVDLDRLEQQINHDEEARMIYNQYCRLHRGTQLVCERFRMKAPPEKVPDGSRTGILDWFPTRRLGRLSLVAGSMAATIILVSGAVLLMQPKKESGTIEQIALNPSPDSETTSIVSVSTPIRSFNTETVVFELGSTREETLVPATWKPEINLHSEFLNQRVAAPVPQPVFSGLEWGTPTRIATPALVPLPDEYRVYRGLDSGSRRTSDPHWVSYQFQK